MRVVIATTNSPYGELSYTRKTAGGAERGLRTYAEHAAVNHPVTYLSTAHTGFRPRSRFISERVSGVDVVHLAGPSIPVVQPALASLRRRAWIDAVSAVCRDFEADVVVTYATIPDTLAAVRAKRVNSGTKVVEWMAGRSWQLHLDRVPGDIDDIREAFAGKDLTLFESGALEGYTREQLARLGLPDLGAVARVEFPSARNVTPAAAGAGEWPGARGPLVSCMATFKPGSKRQDLLIAAWPTVLERVGEATLVLTGEGPLRQQMMRQAADLGVSEWVRFTGMLSWEDVGLLRSASTLTALPTEFEGRPQSIIESLSAGVPVVASDIPAVREALEPLGDVRELCLCGNTASEFSDTITRLLCDEGSRMLVRDAISRLACKEPTESLRTIDAALLSVLGGDGF